MKTLLRLLCSFSALMAMVMLLTAQNNRHEGLKCSPTELTRIPSRHLQSIIDRIYYTDPDLKRSETQAPHFKRRLLMWEFDRILDKNGNGLIDHNEGLNRLPGSMICKVTFIKECDKDQSRSVSPQEWLDCFNIPACNEKCQRGRLDKIRCECHCTTNVIQGRVMSFLGTPLREARILSTPAPYTQLASTNRSGHFRMTETCTSSQSYTIRKDGYIPVQVEGRSWGATPLVLIHLEDAEPPSIIIHPRSKVRLNGQSANFTCKVEGTVPIKIYWYKNGNILQKEHVGSASSLFIADATGAQGFYTCKAVNDYGSEISNEAVLTIKEPKEDTCTSTPSKHVLEFRSGCVVPGTGKDKLILDIGRCSNEPCSHGDSRSGISARCAGDEDCCCGPVETSKVEIKCGPSTMYMERVTKCGCTSCVKRETVLKGVVLGGPFGEPISNIRVVLRKQTVAVSDKKGKFSLTVPEDEDRLTVTFQDPNDRYFDTTMTLPFQRGQTVFHKVTLQLEDPPVEFDSTQELKVPVGHEEENMAELEIPANTLLQRDGTPYKGKAKLRLNVMDPRNATDLLSAPGDFTTVDQFGSVQPLKTYGMLRIKVEDENNQQLSLTDNVKLYLDANMIKLPRNSTGEMPPRLWWLDEKTSRWRDMGEMRPTEPNITRNKRQLSSGLRFYIGEIQTDRISVVNIDIEWRRCYVRAEVLTERDGGPEPVDGATISLIGKEDEDQEQYYGYTEAVTNQNGVACLPAWCDSSVYLQASRLKFGLTEDKSFGTSISYPIPDNIVLQSLPPELSVSIVEGNQTNSFRFITKVSSSDGPIFRGNEFAKCLDPFNNARAFKFYAKKMEKVEEFNDFGFRPKGHPLSWYTTDPKLPEKEDKKCFVKIKSESDKDSPSAPMISVESYTPDRKERYGFSVKEQSRTNETSDWTFWAHERYDVYTTCVEYRCSELGKETYLKVMTLSEFCYRSELIPSLIDAQPVKRNGTLYRGLQGTGFYAPAKVSDGKFGLYSGVGNAAEENCLHGSVDREGDVKMKSDGYAVSVIDPLECPWEWFEVFYNETGYFP